MKPQKIVYIAAAMICCTLAIIFNTITLFIDCVYNILDAAGHISGKATNQLIGKIKNEE